MSLGHGMLMKLSEVANFSFLCVMPKGQSLFILLFLLSIFISLYFGERPLNGFEEMVAMLSQKSDPCCHKGRFRVGEQHSSGHSSLFLYSLLVFFGL